MIKSDALIRLEHCGILYQDDKGGWYTDIREDVDLTPYLLEAGMFEH